MSEKLSQVTDGDVLSAVDDPEQTLGGMTGDETQTQTAGGTKTSNKSGGSKTLLITGGICLLVTAALTGSYMYITQSSSNVVKGKSVKKKIVETVEEPKLIVEKQNTENGFPNDNVSKEGKVAADFLTRDNNSISLIDEVGKEKNELNTNQNSVPSSEVPVVVAGVPIVGTEVPVLGTEVPVLGTEVPVVVAEVPIVGTEVPVVATSVNASFDSIATRVDQISTRVDGLEKFKSAQDDLNNQMDNRIVRLESFHDGNRKLKAVKKSNSENAKVVTKKSTKNYTPKSGDVIVDKSKRSENVAQINLENYQFHSIYDGRVWLKNNDGSLSTFAEGEKFPNGELIKRIDHDNFQVVTNKRTIKNK